MKVAVVMPAHNEAETICGVIDHVKRVLPMADVIVVDDFSLDQTAQRSALAGAKVLKLSNRLGYGGSVHAGLRYAHRQGYDVAIQMDADGQHDPDSLPALMAPVASGQVDIALGSRFLGRVDYKIPLVRRAGMKLFSWIASGALRSRITDPTTGFQAHGRRVLEYFAVSHYDTDYLNPDTIIQLGFRGFKACEVPVVMKERVAGRSMFAGGIKPFLYVSKMFLTILAVIIREKVLKPPEPS
jgi:hypothetical protein